ncbi:hypothetical protein C4D60_Mb09t22160 [Musa balbisiana]|uniref:Uncharacterized protein n=1 Tax=Musa balbisiana TaxID=52838 RepID=A0A4S8IIA2_MUSBA|nr:hypothetical protein C4D60_Mb09t22160 [Musa balbisiana]
MAPTPSASDEASLPLAGRVTIVTGASRGIGSAIALRLASLVLIYASNAVAVRADDSDPVLIYASNAVAVRADDSDPSALRRRCTSLSPTPASAIPGSRRKWRPGTTSSASMPGALSSAARGKREDPGGAVVAGGGAAAWLRGVHGVKDRRKLSTIIFLYFSSDAAHLYYYYQVHAGAKSNQQIKLAAWKVSGGY